MPDTKITALTALTAADPANDVLPIVDVSDTTMAASGTTKKISINNILGASGTATLASATISGAASAAGLTVTGSTIPANGVYLPSANNLGFSYNSTLGMTLNSFGLGVGVSPAAKFDSLVADAAESARFRAASGWLRIHPYLNATDVCRIQSTNNTNTGLQTLSLEGFSLRFNTNSGAAMIIDNLMNTVSNVNSAVPSLSTNNQMVFNLTSNTNLRISVRGSDGVTRTTNLTLA